jgi:NADPH2:quinone reductase
MIESKAYYLESKGDPQKAFSLRSHKIDDPIGTEVVVEAEAFGLNYADVVMRKGLYREAPPFPYVPGYEVVGKIVACGPDADRSLVGQRVTAFCRFGGYAQHVVTHDYAVVPVNDEPAEELLALCTQAVTAYYMAEYLTQIHSIDKVLVHAAAGGVGTILIQLAKNKGATVIAKVGRKEKEQLVKDLGADHVVNYRSADYAEQIKSIIGDDRIDVSFNPAAGSTYKKDMALLGSGGRLILFGASELGDAKWGFFSKLNFVRKMGLLIPVGLMMRSKNILGVNMLKIADNRPEVMQKCLQDVVQLYNDGKLKPQTGGKFNYTELPDAHLQLEQGITTGKLAIFW